MSQSDLLKDFRIKSRYILELRYPPIVQIFDNRGVILEKIHPQFSQKMKDWNVENANVAFTNDPNKQTKVASIGHMKSSITYEDPSTLSEFIDDSNKFIKSLDNCFQNGFKEIKRIGFRAISIFNHPKASDYKYVHDLLYSKFISKEFTTSLEFKDFNITLEHDSCRIFLGPCKRNENWVSMNFKDLESNIPEFGIGMDIDSFTVDLQPKNVNELIQGIHLVQTFAFKIEEEIFRGLI